MNRKEFLEQLQVSLSGEVPQREIMSQLDYYDRYIRQESINKNEETIVEELGSPHLIAKTIIDSYERTYGKTYIRERDNQYQDSSNNYNEGSDFNRQSSKRDIFNIPWYIKIFLVFTILILLLPIIIIGGVLLKLILSLLPIILIVLLVITVIKMGKK